MRVSAASLDLARRGAVRRGKVSPCVGYLTPVEPGVLGVQAATVYVCVYTVHTQTRTHTHTRAQSEGRQRGRSRGRKEKGERRWGAFIWARTRASKSGGRSSGLCCGRQLRGWRSGLHLPPPPPPPPGRGWRGVDQYVKIESDATHPAPLAPFEPQPLPGPAEGIAAQSTDLSPTHHFLRTPAGSAAFPNRRPYGIRFVTANSPY